MGGGRVALYVDSVWVGDTPCADPRAAHACPTYADDGAAFTNNRTERDAAPHLTPSNRHDCE